MEICFAKSLWASQTKRERAWGGIGARIFPRDLDQAGSITVLEFFDVQKPVFDHAVQICPLNTVKEVRYFGNHRPARYHS